MKLNVGSNEGRGRYKHKPWLNVDISMRGRPHVRGSAYCLPFKNDSFDEIHCIHVLEHMPRHLYLSALSEMLRVLEPGGQVRIEVPDFVGHANLVADADKNGDERMVHVWTTAIYGKCEHEGMCHHWGFSETLLKRKMKETGFSKIVRIHGKDQMLSNHHRNGPVILMGATK